MNAPEGTMAGSFSRSVLILSLSAAAGCTTTGESAREMDVAGRVSEYSTVELKTDLSGLSENQLALIGHLIQAADLMDEIFWQQAYGDRSELLAAAEDPSIRRYLEINYGPWDRLRNNEPFLADVGPKPAGANFYPSDMTREEFEAAATPERAPLLTSLYTLVRRDDAGDLVAVPYAQAWPEMTQAAAGHLRQAAGLAADPGFRRYLELRAEALLTDDYYASDLAWMEMKDNDIDVVIGPIETYEDELFGYKAAHEAYVLLKDKAWSERLDRVAAFLPELQASLPVPAEYRAEEPGSDSDLGAYEALYYTGQANAGSKTIAINLPNDERVQLAKGTRRLQLKNSIRAKFDRILLPISGELIAEDQRGHVTFDAFFENTMYHEVAHGLGIKNTIDGASTVREALREQASALEEGKADVLGLYMISELVERGELGEPDLMDNYVTFTASIFRSIRFGTASAHGRANLVRFNFFREMGAISRDDSTGEYRVDRDKMDQAVDALSERILTFQGDGDYQGANEFMARMAVVGPQLREDLARLETAGIPRDIVFRQGPAILGLD